MSLEKKLDSVEFVLILCQWQSILRTLHGISKSFQNPITNSHNACRNLEEAKRVIENLRDSYGKTLLECKKLCSKWGLSNGFYVKRQIVLQYSDKIDGDRRLNVTDKNFQVKIVLPVIDTVLFQLDQRFQKQHYVTDNFDLFISNYDNEIRWKWGLQNFNGIFTFIQWQHFFWFYQMIIVHICIVVNGVRLKL